jgi:hypothetical protein
MSKALDKDETFTNGLAINFVFENAFDTSGIPDDMILPLLSNLVKDTALQLLKTYMRDHGSDGLTEKY